MYDRVNEIKRFTRGYARTSTGQIHYATAGEGDALLMIHQSAQSWRVYARAGNILSARYRIIAVDLPGFGESDPLSEPFDVSDIARVLLEVMDAIGIDRFRITGHHTGATISGEMAAAYPERVLAIAPSGYMYRTPEEREKAIADIERQRLRPVSPRFDVKADGSHLWRSYERISLRRWQSKLSGMRVRQPFPALVLPFDQVQQDPAHTLDDDDVELINESIVDNLRAALYGASPTNRAIARYDLLARLPLIKAPTLIIQSTGPFEQPLLQRAAMIQRQIAGSRVHTFEDGDIFIPHSRAREFAEVLLAFFQSAGGSPAG